MALNLNNVSLRISAGFTRQFPGDPIPQVAFSGRSNVGKSSLINSLLNRKSLARVSAAPGKTITVNFYEIDKKLFFVDLPGYGFAKRRAEDQAVWSQLTDGYFTDNKNIDRVGPVIQLIDSRIGPTADDEMMLDYLIQTGLPFFVVATKADKLNATERKKSEELFANHPLIPKETPVLFYSSLKTEGRQELWKLISAYTGVKL
ncbi:MAG: YihA family ribosome biogenesis GTP-binding protein [Ruminococcaceae bacterium]|nr:YihA family ribosome biogenesis GTP-binding protein [Oscillospiraceae bacterium]